MTEYPMLSQLEIYVSDRHRAEEFYSKLLGWKFAPTEILNYSIVEVDHESKFGIALVSGVTKMKDGVQGVTPFFKVDQLNRLELAVKTLGGKISKSPRPVPGVGQAMIIQDPDGNNIGLFEPFSPSKTTT